jgi:hypothetical protein
MISPAPGTAGPIHALPQKNEGTIEIRGTSSIIDTLSYVLLIDITR